MAGRDGDAEIYSWGWGHCGQLGHGDEKKQLVPKSIDKVSLQGQKIKNIVCGVSYTAAITVKGDVFTWGYGKYGQLGHNDRRHQTIPRRVKTLQRMGIQKIAVGREHTVALTAEGKVYTWGCGAFGVLGLGDDEDRVEPSEVCIQQSRALATQASFHAKSNTIITQEVGPEGIVFSKVHSISEAAIKWVDIACGVQHTLLLDINGEVYSCGMGKSGRLGHNNTEDLKVPTLVRDLSKKAVESIHCGWHHSLALTKTGQVFTWGAGDDFQLGAMGLSREKHQSAPSLLARFVKINKKSGEEEDTLTPVTKMARCGGKHNLILSESGKLFTWGRGAYGRLGHGNFDDMVWPTEVSYFDENRIELKDIAGGGYHSMAVTSAGCLYTWGCGEYGRLGHGDEKHQSKPLLVQALSGKPVTCINAGAFMSIAMTGSQQDKQSRTSAWRSKGCPIS